MTDFRRALLEKKKVYAGNEINVLHRLFVSFAVSFFTLIANNQGEHILVQNPLRIFEQLSKGLSVLVTVYGFPVGYLTTYNLGKAPSGKTWWEVGTGFVPRPFRGYGLGHVLYEGAAARHKNDVIVGTTKNPVALHLSVSAGFEVEPYTKVPTTVRQGLCYEAPCFVPNGSPGCCASEKNLGGNCVARVRWPVS